MAHILTGAHGSQLKYRDGTDQVSNCFRFSDKALVKSVAELHEFLPNSTFANGTSIIHRKLNTLQMQLAKVGSTLELQMNGGRGRFYRFLKKLTPRPPGVDHFFLDLTFTRPIKIKIMLRPK